VPRRNAGNALFWLIFPQLFVKEQNSDTDKNIIQMTAIFRFYQEVTMEQTTQQAKQQSGDSDIEAVRKRVRVR
jgi:hypothetical protein